ncbi:MAG: hypothetical protein LUD69_03190, partial [Oscillospiraceae bacterium]|nr:hypothetical protein [Oscillospiraceae bacterium]
ENNGTLLMDATVAPADIKYPTDIDYILFSHSCYNLIIALQSERFFTVPCDTDCQFLYLLPLRDRYATPIQKCPSIPQNRFWHKKRFLPAGCVGKFDPPSHLPSYAISSDIVLPGRYLASIVGQLSFFTAQAHLFNAATTAQSLCRMGNRFMILQRL